MNTEEKIIEVLKNAGFEVFIVGGFVRDTLLGIEPHDVDIVTNATPDEIVPLFEENFTTKLIGDNFPVVSVNGIEVATYRTEISTGHGHKDFEVAYAKTLIEDLERRDFTIGAMCMCPVGGDIIDMFDGITDLENKVIRFVGNPFDRINQDPVRMLRAFRFAARFDATVEEESFEAIKASKHLIKHVTMERIRLEIMKAMETEKPSVFFTLCQEAGLLEYFLPSLAACWKHEHGRFHLEDIFEHNMLTGDALTFPCPLLRLTAYLHDVGKPIAWVSNADGSFVGHEKFGRDVLIKELGDLRFSTAEILFVTRLVRLHMSQLQNLTRKAANKLMARLIKDGVSPENLIRLKIADLKGATRLTLESFTISQVKNIVAGMTSPFSDKAAFSLKDLAIDGKIVMEKLNIKPGPLVGEILHELFEIVMEVPEWNTREILTAIL
jgi:tRNA nucleotidyltransferase (CCA-adding enzyme)